MARASVGLPAPRARQCGCVGFARVCGGFGEGPRGRAGSCSPSWTGRTPHGARIRSSRRHDSMCCRPHAAIPRRGVLSGRRGDTTPHAAAGRADPRADDAARRLRHVGLAHLLAPDHCRVASLSRPLGTCSSFLPSTTVPHTNRKHVPKLQSRPSKIPSTNSFPMAHRPGTGLISR